jgi:peroxiredoxin Q/BCP
MIDTGQKFPDFTLPDQDGKAVSLADLKGKWVVVYAYPKDDTPGCTLEGRGFTALKSEFDQANTRIFGLSQDDVKSHKDFCGKFDFTISLLADTEAKLLNALGVGQSDYKGTMYWNRVTFVIDPQGITRKVYPQVKVDGHEKAVLADILALQGSTK